MLSFTDGGVSFRAASATFGVTDDDLFAANAEIDPVARERRAQQIIRTMYEAALRLNGAECAGTC
jgi:hypothetical protein